MFYLFAFENAKQGSAIAFFFIDLFVSFRGNFILLVADMEYTGLFICLDARARLCMRVCAYEFIQSLGERGSGGRALCARSYTYMSLWMFAFINLFCLPVCVYWYMWVFLHVKRQELFFFFFVICALHKYSLLLLLLLLLLLTSSQSWSLSSYSCHACVRLWASVWLCARPRRANTWSYVSVCVSANVRRECALVRARARACVWRIGQGKQATERGENKKKRSSGPPCSPRHLKLNNRTIGALIILDIQGDVAVW